MLAGTSPPLVVLRTKPERPTAARVISVGGGKGGVGKSVVAANLAIAMAQEGRRVIVVDADLGAANLHTLFGIDRAGPTLQALFTHRIEALEQALIATEVPNLSIVPGSGAVVGAANINHGQKQRLLRQITRLPADVVIVDVGAGAAYNALDLFLVADQRVVVMTPQLTSVQNGYGFLKAAVWRELRHIAASLGHAEVVEAASAGETNRVADLLVAARRASGPLATALERALANFGARLIGNNVFIPGDARAFLAMSRMAQDFLGISVPVLGHLRASRRVHDSVNRRRPVLLDAAHDDAAQSLRAFASRLLADRAAEPSLVRREQVTGDVEPPTVGLAVAAQPS